MEHKIMFRQNLALPPNDEKRNKHRINKGTTYDVVPMMKNKSNKEET